MTFANAPVRSADGPTSILESARRDEASPSPPNAPALAPPSNSQTAVLLSDEHYKHSLGIVRHLGRQGVRVSMVAASKNSLACCSRHCREVILSPAGTVAALVETMLQAVKHRHFDLVMPVSYPMTLALAQRRELLDSYTRLEVVASHTLERAADKATMIALAGKLGVPAPRTCRSAEIHEHADELIFPVVIKPQQESPGRPPIRYAHNLRELWEILPSQTGRKLSGDTENYLVQEFIPGNGCGFFATYQRGVCKRIFMHRRLREYPATGGVSSCAESFYDPKLEFYGRRMLDALHWHGVAMVEFRRDSRDGEYKLMEINPKFWGSLDLALAAGADFPGDLCQMALGRTLPFSDQYRRNLRFQWPFSGHGELFHLWTRPQSIFGVALDFLNPRVKSNVWLGDLGPNFRELGDLAGKVLRAGKG